LVTFLSPHSGVRLAQMSMTLSAVTNDAAAAVYPPRNE
jgi:hypothetical protein